MKKKDQRTKHLEVRVTPKEKESYIRRATAMGLSLSVWVRLTLREATKKQ